MRYRNNPSNDDEYRQLLRRARAENNPMLAYEALNFGMQTGLFQPNQTAPAPVEIDTPNGKVVVYPHASNRVTITNSVPGTSYAEDQRYPFKLKRTLIRIDAEMIMRSDPYMPGRVIWDTTSAHPWTKINGYERYQDEAQLNLDQQVAMRKLMSAVATSYLQANQSTALAVEATNEMAAALREIAKKEQEILEQKEALGSAYLKLLQSGL